MARKFTRVNFLTNLKSAEDWCFFFLGHNLLYFGLRKDILWRLTRSAKERWGRVQNFDFNTFLERWEPLVQKKGSEWVQNWQFSSISTPFPGGKRPISCFLCVCVYITSFLFSLSCSYLLPFVSFSGYSSVSFSFPYLLFSLFFYSLFTIFSDFPAYLPHLLERFWNVPERFPHHFSVCVLVCSMVIFSCLKRMKAFANVCENKNLSWTTCKIVSLLSFWSKPRSLCLVCLFLFCHSVIICHCVLICNFISICLYLSFCHHLSLTS